ncbi:MAG: 30S ribosomal protein S1 [Proteobacteria bacterium]|nr:30S ribosomal protein S1 [Pseudomonadota bacterium]
MNTEETPTDAPALPTGPEVVKRGRTDADVETAPDENPEVEATAPEATPDEPAEAAPEAAPEPAAAPAPAPSQGKSLDDLLGSGSDLLGDAVQTGSALDAADLSGADALAAEMNQDFAALLAATGGMTEFKNGDKVRGTVVSITNDSVFVDLGMKSEAWLDKRECLDDDGNLTVEVGQDIDAQIVKVFAEGVRLSRGALKAAELSEMLAEAHQGRIPIEGKVTGFNDGGLEVRIGSRRAFCPKSQIDREFTEDLAAHVGETYRFLVTRYDPTGRKIVVSRRSLLESEAKEMAKETRALLQEGAVVDGSVRKLAPFGAFVDLGGVDGLIHISELSWDRVEDPSTVVSVGDVVRVKILRIDKAKDRIGLSLRKAQGDPWKTLKDDWEVGKTYEGTVTRLADFGAFIKLAPGLEGLCHVSELDWKRVKHPRDVLTEGQTITVKLLEVDKKKRRLSLSVKQVSGADPRAEAMKGVKKGERLNVVVEKVEQFGVFCTIADGVTGLIPNSHMNTPRGTNHSRQFKPGTKLEVMVIDLDKRRGKITLSRKALEEDGARADYDAYKKAMKAEEEASSGMTALEIAFANARKR